MNSGQKKLPRTEFTIHQTVFPVALYIALTGNIISPAELSRYVGHRALPSDSLNVDLQNSMGFSPHPANETFARLVLDRVGSTQAAPAPRPPPKIRGQDLTQPARRGSLRTLAELRSPSNFSKGRGLGSVEDPGFHSASEPLLAYGPPSGCPFLSFPRPAFAPRPTALETRTAASTPRGASVIPAAPSQWQGSFPSRSPKRLLLLVGASLPGLGGGGLLIPSYPAGRRLLPPPLTRVPQLLVPADGEDHQQVAQDVHHDGEDEDGSQGGSHPGGPVRGQRVPRLPAVRAAPVASSHAAGPSRSLGRLHHLSRPTCRGATFGREASAAPRASSPPRTLQPASPGLFAGTQLRHVCGRGPFIASLPFLAGRQRRRPFPNRRQPRPRIAACLQVTCSVGAGPRRPPSPGHVRGEGIPFPRLLRGESPAWPQRRSQDLGGTRAGFVSPSLAPFISSLLHSSFVHSRNRLDSGDSRLGDGIRQGCLAVPVGRSRG